MLCTAIWADKKMGLNLTDRLVHQVKPEILNYVYNPQGGREHCYRKKEATVGQNGRLFTSCNFFSF